MSPTRPQSPSARPKLSPVGREALAACAALVRARCLGTRLVRCAIPLAQRAVVSLRPAGKVWRTRISAGELKKPRQISGGRVGYLVREREEFAESRGVSAAPLL